MNQGGSLTIELAHLTVTDPDNSYPTGFTLKIFGGNNYTFNGTTITPDANFSGQLTIPVSVNDGENESNHFDLKVDVIKKQNEPPIITGQEPLSVNQGGSLTIELRHLTVTDPDNPYPTDFTLKVFGGNNYTSSGTTITPDANFSGQLTIPVSVNDGENESNRFDLKVDVIKKQNESPLITGQQPLSVNQGGSLTIELGHLTVTDPDNSYPTGFTLKIFGGNNYTFIGTTITPDTNFSGPLSIPVSVNDGENESNRFDLKVDVIKKQNESPVITGQQPLSVNQGGSLTIELAHLTVTDPDNSYPTGFTLKIFGGNNYTFSGTTITPASTFSGQLTIPVTVNDGENESNRFDLKVDVIKKRNEPPAITSQQPLSVNQGGNLTIELAHLTVTDPDNSYPTGFTLKIFGGNNYTFSGTTITPNANFSGQLTIPVTVNDGENESNRFDLKVDVIKKQNEPPVITGQQPLSVNQAGSLTIELAHLTVTDPDNTYPTDFTLKIFGGNNYTFSGTTITPSANFSGQLIIPVTVNDGENESNRFDLKVDVIKKQNEPPVITGQQRLSVNQGGNLTIDFSHLIVTDLDNKYPIGFTLKVFPGVNFAVTDLTITPSSNFTGSLTASVTVNDGQNESNVFYLKIEVVKVQNVAPQITGQQTIKINEDETVALHLGNLIVTDPDSGYPKDFSLKIKEGSHYKTAGSTIIPEPNFYGELTVPVIVNDGKNDSSPFNLKVIVSPVNDVPVISAQVPLSTNKNILVPIALSDFMVTDPDNKYPEDFTLKILPGNNYAFAGNIVSPAPDFVGTLNVPIIVNDGKTNSPEFNATIEVLSPTVNAPPTITGQKPIRITRGTSVTLQLSHLQVSDPDNEYPIGFTLMVFPGPGYTVNDATVTPSTDIINETFSVNVTVNDGQDDSAPFQVKIQVVPSTQRPQINGQKELTVPEDTPLTIHLDDLIVVDADDPDYPTGFLLIVLPPDGNVYTRNGNSITPAPNLNGFIEVGVLVSDGTNTSEEFKMSILVTPVNDPPEFIEPDTTVLAYEPGHDPLPICENINLRDVDDDYLILAEIGFDPINYNPIHDQCLFPSSTSTLRSVHDADGRLFLIGHATIDDYLSALRSIQYNYVVTKDATGNPAEILAGPRKVYMTVFDGQLGSATFRRTITMEIEISLDIPNAFTPNGDHQNDTWHIDLVNANRIDEATIKIYDKRGAVLYQAVGLQNEWDGSSNGQTLPADTYYYIIDLNLSYMKKTYKGAVTILH